MKNLKLVMLPDGEITSPDGRNVWSTSQAYRYSSGEIDLERPFPRRKRSCQDVTIFLLFIIFFAFMGYIVMRAVFIRKSNPQLILHGYDNWGNICGQNNERIPQVVRSGVNMTQKPYLKITLVRNVTLQTECTSSCPADKYDLSVFHRCWPKDTRLPFFRDAINVTRTFVEDCIDDLSVAWKEVTYACSISLVLSIVLLIALRYLAGLIIWLILLGVSGGTLAASGYTWAVWHNRRIESANATARNHPFSFEKRQIAEQWFAGALFISFLTVVFLLIVLAMRKRLNLVALLFREAGRAISAMPFILLQPLLTFSFLVLMSTAWLCSLVYIQSSRNPVLDPDTGFVSYVLDPFFKYLKWYNLFALLWISHFAVSCQHFIVASAVSSWYFTRDKSKIGSPIARGLYLLVRYHLGSIALGSLLVAIIKAFRILLKKAESIVSRYRESCSGVVRACRCCFWFFEKFIIYINKNAYIEMAIHGDSFCCSARRAFSVLSSNALRLVAVNSVGDFLLFLAKLTIVTLTSLLAIKLCQDKFASLNHPATPIVASAVFAYMTASILLSIYEMAIDTLFVCFLEDGLLNDGSHARPYFMSNSLRSLIDTKQSSSAASSASDSGSGSRKMILNQL